MPKRSPSSPRAASCTSAPAAPAPAVGARSTRRRLGRSAGLSLVELLIFIVVVGIAIGGVIVVYDRAVRGSADPIARKQALAIAESLLSEVLAQPFTYCDPQDAVNDPAAPPASTAACTGGAAASQDRGGGALGPQPGTETRFSATDPFDNVADYHGYAMGAGIYGLDDGTTPIAALAGYTASVAIV
ncbi:MAG: type IV pilus modification PilV family protein, partial [Caldimonas sp.]